MYPTRNVSGKWTAHWLRLLALLAPALPAFMTVIICTDLGLWSPRLWRVICAAGGHPVMRIRTDCTVALTGSPRRLARLLVPGPGHAWVSPPSPSSLFAQGRGGWYGK